MYTLDSNPVRLTYDNKELLSLIDKYLLEINEEFSFKSLCSYVVNQAKQKDKVEGAPHTRYSSSEISLADGIRISKILWEKIWNKEIIIAFGDNPYRGISKDDTRFCIIKRNVGE